MANLAEYLLASAARRPEHVAVREGEAELTYADLDRLTALGAGWLRAQLDVPVQRRAGSFEVQLDQPSGPLRLEFDQNSTAVLVRPGQPDGRVAIRRRDVADCLAEELRRLDDDDIYFTALGGVSDVDRSEMP